MKKTKGKNCIEKQDENLKKKNKKIIFNTLVIICITIMAFSFFNIIHWLIENNGSNSVLTEIESSVKITQENIIVGNRPVVKSNYDFTELLKKNAETVGWISVPNTKINYPVVQSQDNDFYLNHSFDKSQNTAGWVFADYNCDMLNSQNIIIYGHNRRDFSMFGSLKSILNDGWRSNEDNLFINFADLNETGIYKVFSTFICSDADVKNYLKTNFANQESFEEYVKLLKKNSLYKFDTNIENAEKIVTLYTCYGQNNKRLLVFAVKVY